MLPTFATLPLSFINSLTKYPSILTYQPLDDRGRVVDEAPVLPIGQNIIATEKIDGTNARIILAPDGDWLIGSRNELLTGRGDRVVRDADRIVETILGNSDRDGEIRCVSTSEGPDDGHLTVLYGEVYGHKVGRNGKEYASASTAFRLFDVQTIRMDDAARWALVSPEEVAAHRETGFAGKWNSAPGIQGWVPNLDVVWWPPNSPTSDGMPLTKADVRAWLEKYRASKAGIDVNGKAEGVVVRTADRSWIRKIRFEDYAR